MSTQTAPSGTVGVYYRQYVAASGGTPPDRYVWADTVVEPPSLTVANVVVGSVAYAELSGTPTEVGTFLFSVDGATEGTPPATVHYDYQITIEEAEEVGPALYRNFTGYEAGDRTDELAFNATVTAGAGHHAGSAYYLNMTTASGSGKYVTYPVDSGSLWMNAAADGVSKKGIIRTYFRINTAYPTAALIIGGFGITTTALARMTVDTSGYFRGRSSVSGPGADSAAPLALNTSYRADITLDYLAQSGNDTCT